MKRLAVVLVLLAGPALAAEPYDKATYEACLARLMTPDLTESIRASCRAKAVSALPHPQGIEPADDPVTILRGR